MRTILAILAVLALAVPASAQLTVAGGGSQDWVKASSGGAWTEPSVNMMPAFDYALGRLSMSFRASEDGDTLQEYGLGTRWVSGPATVFVLAVGETWGPEIAGERKMLGGARLGIRGEADGLPVEMSFRYTAGSGGVAHAGVFLGLWK